MHMGVAEHTRIENYTK